MLYTVDQKKMNFELNSKVNYTGVHILLLKRSIRGWRSS